MKRVGYNMQTIPDDWEVFDEDHPVHQGMRDLFLADEGHYLAKCDLKGADGWTIGSYMTMLGDPTMLDDLKFGIKPPQVVAFILKYGAEAYQQVAKDRFLLKDRIQIISKELWEYFVSKQGFYGSCYLMGPQKLTERVFIESEGKVNLSLSQGKEFQSAIKVRYNISILHKWMERYLRGQRYPAKLTASNGFTRIFYSRNGCYPKQPCDALGEALAHLPQVYTTAATLKAAYNLWVDPENHYENNKLRVEILHQVHDELLVQFKIEDITWAITKLKSWFDNPIQIANQTITIPFDGSYGTSWAMDEKTKVGEIK